ncbi:MAG: tRNA (adenosine(37)-N6)-threonylcarbamoyltransferase complex dimerization subunit type 1 TsaB [Glaciecola sp.]
MNILAIDTATEACSVALLKGEQVDAIFDVIPQQQSQQILPMIDTLLTKHNLNVSDLSAIAYGRGPGSFTGVRIATSTVQGLALGANLPVVEVSTLAAMAQQNYEQHGFEHSVVMIDARMQEVYFAQYSVENGLVKLRNNETVCPPETAYAYMQEAEPFALAGTGYEAYSEIFREIKALSPIKVHYPNAQYMLKLAKHAFEQNKCVSVENITPVYLRDKVTWKKLPHKV